MSTDSRQQFLSLLKSIQDIEQSIAEKKTLYLHELEENKRLKNILAQEPSLSNFNNYDMSVFKYIDDEIENNKKIYNQICQEIYLAQSDDLVRNNYNTNGFSVYNTCDTMPVEPYKETTQQNDISQPIQQQNEFTQEQIPCYIPQYVNLQFKSLLKYIESNGLTCCITFSTERKQINLALLKQVYRNNSTLMIVQMRCGNIFGIFFNNTTKSLFKIISPVPYECGLSTVFQNEPNSYLQITDEYIDYNLLKIYFSGIIEFNFNPVTKICIEPPYMDYFSLYSVN
ncbi:hypothetical protein KM1_315180 [Entamoeba histolytica HM-3:IMSS]|uniref:Uncharacterized protein n=5 Tax=Entamoeba histolytica TaxID=5759 RepID=C4LXD2_ENTH1|nr:hypothetical protein EHI_098520 [Entamoeba histolytica HM-1:IMSS]EMD46096.1 Hypothetical protein EHI5A_147600 [Entamoeba histolytica KU27]EMS12176.1 hypothetical protein KM1_315180 [Entamoeba histolytica HM-3:IMSS]ENY64502.1 hypothetical protein EHI7A_198640 [Entamoeba histolytica HM-1:IMSS-A]GAT93409.1 hypothetical protein CL6EHI_098520 [Entamoeba histolytica]EAL50577.1 hypothetical protein EHI_098520 [Entamoeba histolytica HM-1:IMSS]|eukprot:XP_655961.1 hypothetical protein EHI_098520 [Entamoeba histolytica HM-1:IMSS]